MVEESVIAMLKEIGAPVAIISSTIVAICMRSISGYLAKWAGVITLVAVAAYIPIDLYPKARDALSETRIEATPEKFTAFLSDGAPTDVVVVARRGDQVVDRLELPAVDGQKLANRPVSLERNPSGDGFYALCNQTRIGVIDDETLEATGFQRDSPDRNKPELIGSSKRVYVHNTWSVPNTPLGRLELTFLGIQDGKALLTLSSSSYGAPQPATLLISNKAFDVQCFEGKYEVTVQVREADFGVKGEEWAAFTIIVG